MLANGSQKDLADYLGKSRQAVSYYCCGGSAPDLETLAKIADYFGCTTDYLLGRTNVMGFDVGFRAICDKTGLSERSVEALIADHDGKDAELAILVDAFLDALRANDPRLV